MSSVIPERSPRRPRLLVLSQIPPFPRPLNGARQRVHHIVKGLCQAFDVTLVAIDASSRPPDTEDYAKEVGASRVLLFPFNSPRGRSRWGGGWETLRAMLPTTVPRYIEEGVPIVLLDELRELHASGPFAGVWAFRSWMAELGRLARIGPVVVDVDDFESVHFRQEIEALGEYRRAPVHRRMLRQLADYESRLVDRFEGVVLAKEEDRALVRCTTSERVVVVPNGATLPESLVSTPVADRTEQTEQLLFVGTLNYAPNLDAIEWLVRDIWPLIRARSQRVRLVIAGRDRLPESFGWVSRTDGVTVIESPVSLLPLYDASAAVLAPIRLGAGSRIKVLEALAHGRPLVATREAARGFDIQSGRHYMSADTTDEFAEAILGVLDHRELVERLGKEGRAWVAANATWEIAGEKARSFMQQVLKLPSLREGRHSD